MRWFIGLIVATVISAFGIYFTLPDKIDKPGETVKILTVTGHGSGVHIGNGYIVTAAHVVSGASTVTLRLDDETEQPGEVLWFNTVYDVALIRTTDTLREAPLQCRIPKTGEMVRASGNPLTMEFISTNGRVAGVVREMGPWKLAVPVDITILMGMSGGPVFDMRGNVVGINIGVAMAQLGFTPSLTGIGVIVPGKAICDLIARR